MPVMVLGASGDQGIPLVQALTAAGHEVIAGARRADALAGTPIADIALRHADLDDPASLAAAFAGIEALAFHLPFELDRDGARRMGENIGGGARTAGVGRILFNTACFVADHDLDLSAHDGRRNIEAALVASGATCTLIEPMVFMDNILRVWSRPAIVRHGIFAHPASPGLRINWVCLADVAAAMVSALPRTDLPLLVPLGGSEALVGDEVAERLSLALGRKIVFRSLSPDEFAANMSELVTGSRAVAPHSIYAGTARFYRWYNEQPVSPLVVDPVPVKRLLGIRLTPLQDWAAGQEWT